MSPLQLLGGTLIVPKQLIGIRIYLKFIIALALFKMFIITISTVSLPLSYSKTKRETLGNNCFSILINLFPFIHFGKQPIVFETAFYHKTCPCNNDWFGELCTKVMVIVMSLQKSNQIPIFYYLL